MHQQSIAMHRNVHHLSMYAHADNNMRYTYNLRFTSGEFHFFLSRIVSVLIH